MKVERRKKLILSSFLLFDSTEVPLIETGTTEKSATQERDEENVYCALCDKKITSRREQTRKDGSFEHVFTNPTGIVFRIGCFKEAPGCSIEGEKTDFFSWFPRYSWSIAMCKNCRCHLGWFFSGAESNFFGLILGNLKGY